MYVKVAYDNFHNKRRYDDDDDDASSGSASLNATLSSFFSVSLMSADGVNVVVCMVLGAPPSPPLKKSRPSFWEMLAAALRP